MCGGGFAPPEALKLSLGYALPSGLALGVFLGQSPIKGVAPDIKRGTLRRGTAAAAHPAAKP